ncbi:hypothetical protein I4641_00620 [Waterburya agarophytonicola K14]|uniref:Uncharacterized protein n=1 Tax=Waterburya agarophytonicola KI4 TaxID=2874699 RepID=A0A964FF64_9CYAN|nr:hypothetical protein [Waterburya agarophytonicola]MCC0175484.1 hypothetical protein [Waterburya agarophytonicola KI4]
MDRQMCWLLDSQNRQIIVLHLREHAYQPWKPYNTSKYSVPDYRIPGGSKGWATYQHLRKAGWNLIPTAQANSYAPSAEIMAKRAA